MTKTLASVIVFLLVSAAGRAQSQEFGSVQDAWAHLRAEYRKAAYLSDWEPEPFDKMRKAETTCGGHKFTVLYFDVTRNGALYIVEALPNGRFRIVGQMWGARVDIREQAGKLVARVPFHVSVAENPVTEYQYENGVFGSFTIADIRPEFYK